MKVKITENTVGGARVEIWTDLITGPSIITSYAVGANLKYNPDEDLLYIIPLDHEAGENLTISFDDLVEPLGTTNLFDYTNHLISLGIFS